MEAAEEVCGAPRRVPLRHTRVRRLRRRRARRGGRPQQRVAELFLGRQRPAVDLGGVGRQGHLAPPAQTRGGGGAEAGCLVEGPLLLLHLLLQQPFQLRDGRPLRVQLLLQPGLLSLRLRLRRQRGQRRDQETEGQGGQAEEVDEVDDVDEVGGALTRLRSSASCSSLGTISAPSSFA